MNKLTSAQLNRLTKLLIDCAAFKNAQQLKTIFIDPRLAPWQAFVPTSVENRQELVRRTIALLINKYDRHHRSALLLFLDVLADTLHQEDLYYTELQDFSLELKQVIQHMGNNQLNALQQISHTRAELYAVLKDRFSRSELKELCFELHVDYEELAGDTKKDKARELVIYMENRERLDDLTTTINKLRPDIFRILYKEIEEPGLVECIPLIQTIKAEVDELALVLMGTSGEWKLQATNMSDVEINRVNIVLRPSPYINVSPNKIVLGTILPAETKAADPTIVIRLSQTITNESYPLPFDVIYALLNKQPKRCKNEFLIPTPIK